MNIDRARGPHLPAQAPKETKMKRTISLWLGLLAFAVIPALGQAPATPQATGKIHGQVTNPTGAPQAGGTVTLILTTRAASGPGLSAQTKEGAVLNVDANGAFSGEVPAGTYAMVYRTPGMEQDKQADRIENVKVTAGQEVAADIDMSRKEYIDSLPPETKKQLEEMREHNTAAMKANAVIKNLNADLKVVVQDIHDADTARATASQQLGASASRADLDAKESEIKTAKYTEVETLMTKDTAVKPNESILWGYLGEGQLGLKKYDAAEASFKKALETDAASKAPKPAVQGMANEGLGSIYARGGKVPEANAAYEAAAKIDPPKAAFYLKNEAVIFSQVGNSDAQAAAADAAIAANPQDPLPYYLKGQALVAKATVDPKTQRIVLPPGCGEAYQKYLELAPTGPYASDVKGILDQAGQKIDSSYKAPKASKK
jgi:tetratricopeptide (TPR) repeat protein